jgi:superfamily I DNA/RNA helicase
MPALNSEQKKAVISTEGRVLVLAGAGSGKTAVLTHRIAYLIKEKNVSPDAILGLTFTNKAAHEMRERVSKIIGSESSKKVALSTFHSFCARILRKDIHHLGYTCAFSLYDQKDIRRLLTQIARDHLKHEGDLPSLDGIHYAISLAKNQGLSPDTLNEDPLTCALYERLEGALRAYNALDFDSLLTLTATLFEKFPAILEKYQDQFRYIMIDEYQDTNPIQYKLASLLAKKHNNLFVVGDDDQSIYSFRGAEIKHILEFESNIIIKLETNYRSTPIILQAANQLIQNNENRHDKTLRSPKTTGNKIEVFHAPGEKDEAQAVAQRILWLRKHKGLDWKDIAILYRSNILSRTIEMALMDSMWEKEGQWIRGIPYNIYGGLELSERSEIKDVMAYLRAISNPQDQEALLRIINVPRRGISDQALDLITQSSRKDNVPLWDLLEQIASETCANTSLIEALSTRAQRGVASFVSILKQAQEKFCTPPLSKTLTWLLQTTNYQKAIEEEVKCDKTRQLKWENVMSCTNLLQHYEEELTQEGRSEDITISDFLGRTQLNHTPENEKESGLKENRVHVMTFHSAKGLEFKACFLIALEDHLIPHEKSLTEGGLEEERRLLYVAMTRAKEYLTLSMARKRKKMGKDVSCNPSRFLFEIPQNLLNVSIWKENSTF